MTEGQPGPPQSDARVMLIVEGLDGHRGDYLALFSALLPNCVVAPRPLQVGDLRKHPGPLFFLTIDDHLATFFAAALSRSLSGKRTVGILLRAGECTKPGLKYRLKRAVFRLGARIQGARIVTILPFYVEPDFARIATDWIDDPQFWDLSDAVNTREASSPLAASVKERAQRRRIVVALGGQNRIKGFDFFAQLWLASDRLRSEFLFCSAGAVDAASAAARDAMAQSGAFICDRRISNDELLSLYNCADIVWSCYAPDYNQASGIFGRAAQLGVPSLLREGSYLEIIAARCGQPFLSLSFGDVAGATERLLQWRAAPRDSHGAHASEARKRTLAILSDALRITPETLQNGLPL